MRNFLLAALAFWTSPSFASPDFTCQRDPGADHFFIDTSANLITVNEIHSFSYRVPIQPFFWPFGYVKALVDKEPLPPPLDQPAFFMLEFRDDGTIWLLDAFSFGISRDSRSNISQLFLEDGLLTPCQMNP